MIICLSRVNSPVFAEVMLDHRQESRIALWGSSFRHCFPTFPTYLSLYVCQHRQVPTDITRNIREKWSFETEFLLTDEDTAVSWDGVKGKSIWKEINIRVYKVSTEFRKSILNSMILSMILLPLRYSSQRKLNSVESWHHSVKIPYVPIYYRKQSKNRDKIHDSYRFRETVKRSFSSLGNMFSIQSAL
jgi:hypothetical protein